MKEVRDLILRVADTPSNILVTGERGVGKELVARVIHSISGRREASFVPVACSGISEAHWESGIFHKANNGTLFLDEVGELPLSVQIKLVQVLETKKFRVAEAARSITVDVRIIPSTALDLASEVQGKRFREDLYYMLNVVEVKLPPLRDRPKDIPLLAEMLVARYLREYSRPVFGISEAALVLLKHYCWPGNVRELESTIERAVTLTQAREIIPSDLPATVQQLGTTQQLLSAGLEHEKTLKQVEEDYIRLILDKTGGNKYHAAEILGIDRKTLYRKIAEMEKGKNG